MVSYSMKEQREKKGHLSQQELQLCCDYFSISPQELKNDQATMQYVLEKRTEIYSLMVGYCEMGKLNQEICHDFLSCDEDWHEF